jgi:hypothetical protein
MNRLFVLFLALAIALPVSGADAQRRRGGGAPGAGRAAPMLSIREIERRVVPTMPRSEYLGFDFDGVAVYTLKFLRDGNVIWVEVDGRTGAVLGRTGR